MCKKVITSVIILFVALGGLLNAAAYSTDAALGSSIEISGSSESAIVAAAAGDETEDKEIKVSREDARQISLGLLKKYLGLEIDEKKYSGMVQLIPGNRIDKGYVWQFGWNMSTNDMLLHISTDIDASTGTLLGFSRSESYRNQEQLAIAEISKEQASKLAEGFLEKINPEEFKQVKLEDYENEIIYSGRLKPSYRFRFVREANGISCPENYITLGVSGTDGSIIDYGINWQYEIKLPDTKNLLGKEKAMEIYKDGFSMDLCYFPIRNRVTRYTVPPEVKLAYTPDTATITAIDAQTGDLLDRNGQKLDGLKKRDITPEQKNSITADKPKLFNGSGELDSKEAEAFINVLAKEFFGSGYKAGNLSYSENEMVYLAENRKTWNAEVMEDKPEAFEGKGNITIDSATGEILGIARYIYEDWYGQEYERKLTWEQAYDKAIEVLGRYYAGRLGEINTEQIYQENLYTVNGKLVPDRMVYFGFSRLVNGIPYGSDIISISIDTKTGEVNDVNYNWNTNTSFPEAKGIISSEKAKELFLKEYDVRLVYSQYNKQVDQNKYTPEYRIVYTLELKQKQNGSINIDAFSGKLLNYEGYVENSEKEDFSETIKGNPVEKELSILAYQNIIDRRNFEPDREITYVELLRMLVNAKGYRPYTLRDQNELQFKNIDKKSENYAYLSEAVRYGIIENEPVELKLDAKVTREQMAEWMVKLLKYEKLAQAKGIFVLPYKDAEEVNNNLTGCVAIVKGLGIIERTSEMFRPKENLKMQEAALIIYRAMDSMK